MALDDQLAALAAGELDDDDARALRARAAADPALARTLARHEQLQQLLTDWDAPALPEDAARRLESRVDEALAELDDEPLADRTAPTAPLAAVPDPEPRPSSPPGVVDLDRQRDRRAAASGGGGFAWPSWGAGVAVAAMLAAVVGTGILLGGLPGGADLDTLAGGDDSGEESAQMAEDSAADEDGAPTDGAADTGAADAPAEAEVEEGEAAADDAAAADESAQLEPSRRDGVDVAEGDLLSLLDLSDASSTEDATASTEAAVACVTEALQRDTSQADDREVSLLAEGTYAGRDTVFVAVRTSTPGEDRYEVLAYDPTDCSLLARDATSP